MKNGYLNLSAVLKFVKTQNELNEAMQPTTSNNDSRPVLPYHVHNQADFDNPFISLSLNPFLHFDQALFTWAYRK